MKISVGRQKIKDENKPNKFIHFDEGRERGEKATSTKYVSEGKLSSAEKGRKKWKKKGGGGREGNKTSTISTACS